MNDTNIIYKVLKFYKIYFILKEKMTKNDEKCNKKLKLLNLFHIAPIFDSTSLCGTLLPQLILYKLMMAHFAVKSEPSTFYDEVGHGDGPTFSTNVDIEMIIHLLPIPILEQAEMMSIDGYYCF